MPSRHRLAVATLALAAAAPAQETIRLPDHPTAWEHAARLHGPRAAILVAADRYGARTDWNLPSALTSVETVRDALLRHGGFAPGAVRILSGDAVHLAAVQAAIRDAAAAIGGGDRGLLLVHWVGHGWSKDGQQLLFTHYTEPAGSGFAPTVAADELLIALGRARDAAQARGIALQTVVAFDCCRVAVGAPPRDFRVKPGASWQMFGTRDGRFVEAFGEGGTFPFSRSLADGMRALAEARGRADLAALFVEVNARTRRATGNAQQPQLLQPAGAGVAAPEMVLPVRVGFTLQLVDGLNGALVERATVDLDGTETAFLAGQTARLEAAPGEHVLTVRADGHLARVEALSLAPTVAGATLVVPLLPALTLVRGRLVPPRAGVRLRLVEPPQPLRADYHVVATTSAADGTFELRTPARAVAVAVLADDRVLATVDFGEPQLSFLHDAAGQHLGVAVVECTLPLDADTLRALGEAPAGAHVAGAPAVEPQLSGFDQQDWRRAQDAIAGGDFALARRALANVQGGGTAIDAWRRWVAGRWACAELEAGLRDGIGAGDWQRVDEMQTWWQQARAAGGLPGFDRAQEVEALLARAERERIPIETRRAYVAGNAAYAIGELAVAWEAYRKAQAGANAHYLALLDEQITQVAVVLYGRHMAAGQQAERDGERERALREYAAAMRYNQKRAEGAVRALLRDAELAASETGQAVARQLEVTLALHGEHERLSAARASAGSVPTVWDCEVLDQGKTSAGRPVRVRDRKSGIVFRLIEPGVFRMGSDDGHDEQPVHAVRISRAFYMAETETTQAQWQAVMDSNPSVYPGPNHPVEKVSWHDAQAFVAKLNDGNAAGPYRLPTEAEWEYCCRAGTTTRYAFGDSLHPTQARFEREAQKDSRSRVPGPGDVASFPPNAWGLYDMHGNVWEWCQDWYGADAYRRDEAGAVDPTGPATGISRAIRGGGWDSMRSNLRSACRNGYWAASTAEHNAGFRVVREIR